MKNVTLAIPDELLAKARAYAKRHDTSLNEMIREFLHKNVEQENNDLPEHIEKFRKKLKIDSQIKYNRDELHER